MENESVELATQQTFSQSGDGQGTGTLQSSDTFSPSSQSTASTDLGEIANQVSTIVRDQKEITKTQKEQAAVVTGIQGITILGFLVIVIMVAGMLIQAWSNREASDINLLNEINQQNIELQKLSDTTEALILRPNTPKPQ